MVSLDDLSLLHHLLDLACEPALAHFRQDSLAVEDKSAPDAVFDPVTMADREVEQVIRQALQQARPDDGILGEEFGATAPKNQRVWVIDPIDGTRAYISGAPCWGVLIALNVQGEPILGGMAQPFTQERFIGSVVPAQPFVAQWFYRKQSPRRLRVRACKRLEQATLFTTDPRLFLRNERSVFDAIEQRCKLSRYGMDCYAYALVALGGADVVIESGLSAYDIQALIPIIQAAGGVITDWQGGSAAQGGQVVAAATPELHQEVLPLLSNAANDSSPV